MRRFSFSPLSRARFCADGSRSTLSLSRLQRFEHRPRGGAEVGGVQHAEVGGHHELRAHRFPERFAGAADGRRERRRLRVLPRPDRIGEERRRATNCKQTGEVATGNGHGSLRGHYTGAGVLGAGCWVLWGAGVRAGARCGGAEVRRCGGAEVRGAGVRGARGRGGDARGQEVMAWRLLWNLTVAKEFTELVAWQLSDELRRLIFANSCAASYVARDFKYCNQSKDAARSAASNIAEGFGRFRHREFAQFLRIAMGSLSEVSDLLIDGYGECQILCCEALLSFGRPQLDPSVSERSLLQRRCEKAVAVEDGKLIHRRPPRG